MKYLLWLFIPILLLGQVKTVTQTGVKRSMIRGDATTLTWTVPGDYSADSLLFIAVDADSNAVLRTSTGEGLTVSYSNKSTITYTIPAATTENFISGGYLYDITDVTDSVTLIMGLLNIVADVSNLNDTVLAPIPYYTVALDTSDQEPGVLISRNSTNTTDWWSLPMLADSLGVISGTPADLDSLYTYWVNTHEAQTITGQKNFMGTIPMKLGADTSLRLGGSYLGSPIGMLKNIQSGTTFYTQSLAIPPDTSLTANWRVGNIYLDWDVNHFGKELAYAIEYNGEGKKNKAGMTFAMEPEYEVPAGGYGETIYEWWFGFQWPGDFSLYNNRPFQVNQSIPYSGNPDSIKAGMTLSLNRLWMGTRASGGFMLDWEFIDNGTSYLVIQDTFRIVYSKNNLDWLKQSLPISMGGQSVSLIKLNNLGEVEVSPNAGYKIKLGNNLSGAIGWTRNTSYGNITIEPDSIDWVNFTNDAGINVQNLRIRGLKTDTTGAVIGDVIADANTGVLTTILGENLLLNGDFTNWSGIFKKRIPDHWDFTFLDTTDSYVEESPAGQLHFVTDGTISDQFYSEVSQEAGKIYGYSFYVSQVTDSFVVFVPGWNVVVTQPGFYSGETISLANNPIASILQYAVNDVPTPGELTIDNFKIWKKYGAKKAPDWSGYLEKIINPISSDTSFVWSDDGVTWENISIGAMRNILSSTPGGAGIDNVVEDTSPQLGGDLDLNDKNIVNTTPSFTISPAELNTLDGVSSGIQTQLDGKQPLESTLTDIADGTITENLVNTTYPWADDEVANNITVDEPGIASSIARDDEVAKLYADTLSKSWGVMDTVTTGDCVGWKVDNNITITEVSAYTNTGTVTFNLEERAETTPNTAGIDVMTSDLAADSDQQETGTFSNANLDRDDWLVPTVTSITGDPTIFGITIRYIKTN